MSDQELPLPDYDHLPVGSLQHRIRSLDEAKLRELLDYEQAHNDRPQVLEMVRHRIEELENGASPSPGTQEDEPVEAQGKRSGSPVSPASSSQPIHPPPHGTDGQPGQPKGNRS